MLQTEFIKSLQSNYERVLLDEKPDEKRYQYCILSRGGIRGLLPCSLRYINGKAYLYYDITSRQNVAQLYRKQHLTREWIKDFFWSYGKIKQELGRFLLDERNILLHPEQIFEDLSNHNFSFLYLPYYEDENGFIKLMEFMVERLDYEDEILVECVYKIYEQYEQNGEVYLQEKVFEDIRKLEEAEAPKPVLEESVISETSTAQETEVYASEEKEEKKGIWIFRKNRKNKEKQQRSAYYQNMQAAMEEYAVAEETSYNADPQDEEYGKTVYIETSVDPARIVHKLYTPDGRIAAQLDKEVLTIGKQRGEADLILERESVSRVHARIYREDGTTYLEDLNSTNGTFKNGLRLQPYERRRLEEGDEIQFGKEMLVYR